MSSFDTGFQQAGEQSMQNQRIAEEQRTQRQNNVGAQLLDAINQSSSIKPTMKDEEGNVVANPAYKQAQKERRDLLTQYTSLYSPEQHASFATRLHGLIFGHPTPHTQQPALSPNSSPNTPPPEPGAPPVAAASTPAPPPHPMAPLPTDHPAHKITEGIKALGEGIKNRASAFANPLPAQPQPNVDIIAKYYKDPAEVAAERAQNLADTRGDWALQAAKARGANVKPVHMGDVTPKDAIRNMHTLGYVYAQEDGTPYTEAELSELPESYRIGEFRQGPITYAKAYDQKAGHIGVGGIEYAVYPLGEQGPQTMTPLGQQTSTLPKAHQVLGATPGDNPTLTAGVVATPGLTGGTPPQPAPTATAPASPAGEPPNPQLHTRPTTPLPPTPKPAERPLVAGPISSNAQVLAEKLNGRKSNSKQIPSGSDPATYLAKNGVYPDPPSPYARGTALSQIKGETQKVVARVDAVGANIFGGQDEKPIWTFAYMFDDPKIRPALNKALTMNALANPGTSEDPSLAQQLATAVGATGWSQQQINDAVVQAKNDLLAVGGPDAMKAFARLAGVQEDLTALRGITSGSAAASTIKTMVRAAPVYNVSSSDNFRDMLGVTLNTGGKALHAYPAINPAFTKWFTDGARLARTSPVSTNAPKAPGNAPIVQQSPSTGKFRYSTDGGKTWTPGQPPQ